MLVRKNTKEEFSHLTHGNERRSEEKETFRFKCGEEQKTFISTLWKAVNTQIESRGKVEKTMQRPPISSLNRSLSHDHKQSIYATYARSTIFTEHLEPIKLFNMRIYLSI